MRALVSHPPTGGVEFTEVPRSDLPAGGVRVRVAECGLCGTDADIVGGRYGRAPDGAPFLVLGHENLGTVTQRDPLVTGLHVGQLVVSTVRRGCGACPFCRAERSDFCETGRYTERGIWGAHGFLAEEYVELAGHVVPLPSELRASGVLVEPLSVVEKAIEQGLAVRARERRPVDAEAAPDRALVAGTGAIGMLSSLLLRSRGWQVVAVDRHGDDTLAAQLLAAVGARHEDVATGMGALQGEGFDLVVEATGSAEMDVDLLDQLAPNGVLVLTGIPDGSSAPPAAMGSRLRRLVLGNQAVVGSVNANRDHFLAAVDDLGRFERAWPGVAGRLVGARRSWEEAADVLSHGASGVIKTALVVSAT